MNRRGKRLAFTVAATGLAVLLGLGILHWSTVRDHVEAWYFQLTMETETVEPNPGVKGVAIDLEPDIFSKDWFVGGISGLREISGYIYTPRILFSSLANCTGWPVTFDSKGAADDSRIPLSTRLQNVSAERFRMLLNANNYRVIEQRFPRKAYIVICAENALRSFESVEIGVYDAPISGCGSVTSKSGLEASSAK
jgi:hypothetical protein